MNITEFNKFKVRTASILLLICMLVLAFKAYEIGVSIMWSIFIGTVGCVLVGKAWRRKR